MSVDEVKLNQLVSKFVGDLGASIHGPTILIGEQLGLYKALAEGPMTPKDLADKTGISERYAREWLAGHGRLPVGRSR